MKKEKSFTIKSRRCARLAAAQALYSIDVTKTTNQEKLQQFLEFTASEQPGFEIDLPYFQDLYYSTLGHLPEIDKLISTYCERDFNRIDGVDLAILRYSTYELLSKVNIDAPVIINEAIELSRDIGSEGSFTLINFYLDTLNRKVRQASERAYLVTVLEKDPSVRTPKKEEKKAEAKAQESQTSETSQENQDPNSVDL